MSSYDIALILAPFVPVLAVMIWGFLRQHLKDAGVI